MLLGILSLAWPDEAWADCPVPAVDGIQPYHSQVSQAFGQAAAGALGGAGPSYPSLRQGYPTYQEVSASFPPTILKAIGYLESRWRQFRASPGAQGPTLINSASDPYCAYGVMQIVSGMNGTTSFDPPRVAAEYPYNAGTGALILLWKWNYLTKLGTAVGDNDPAIMEDWYFAVWAYHNGSWLNNPNNPRYDPNRNTYWDPFDYSSYPARAYPYQELIWGYVANPPPGPDGQPLWQSIRLSFPDPAAIGYDFEPVYMPGHIDDPQPIHRDSAQANPTPTPTPSPTPKPTATPSPAPTPTPRPVVDLHLPRRAYLPLVNSGAVK